MSTSRMNFINILSDFQSLNSLLHCGNSCGDMQIIATRMIGMSMCVTMDPSCVILVIQAHTLGFGISARDRLNS